MLIVDDSLTVRMDLKEAFETADYAPTLCETAAAARKALAAGPFAVIVLDVLLPDADGVAFLAELRSQPLTAHIPVLFLSTEAEVRDRIRGMTSGADDYVGKPYDRAYVVSRAQELVRAREKRPTDKVTPVILVVDDSATFRETLKAILETAGYTVLLAATGEEGLRIAAASRPDAIVVDAGLPGIDGATLVRRTKLDAALRLTPCLLLTASEEVSFELTALEAGADAFVRKTDDTAVILARVAAMLRAATSPTTALGALPSLFGPKKVLAVDDSMTFLQELAAQIREEGYDVILASSGEQALEILPAQKVDCILLDLIMPGLSGQETCSRIKASPALRHIPLIVLTAREDRDTLLDAFKLGADDYIPKSSDFDVIKARLRAQIRRKHFEDENRRIQAELLRSEREAAEARATSELARARGVLLVELERANKELESFCYSVSHDLRAPLRAIDGFGLILQKSYSDKLDAQGQNYLGRVRAATQRMGQLIDDLLNLSRIARSEMSIATVDLSELAGTIAKDLQETAPERKVVFSVAPEMVVLADANLMRILLDNLLGNAWKFSGKRAEARIDVGSTTNAGETAYFVRDNGAGFDMKYADKLFGAFQRLHPVTAFEGTGVGLAIVQRVILRHGGRVWAEAAVDRGATFYFTLSEEKLGCQRSFCS